MYKITWNMNNGKTYVEFRHVKCCKEFIKDCLTKDIYEDDKNDRFLITKNISSVYYSKD